MIGKLKKFELPHTDDQVEKSFQIIKKDGSLTQLPSFIKYSNWALIISADRPYDVGEHDIYIKIELNLF